MKKEILKKSMVIFLFFVLIAAPTYALGGYTIGLKVWVPQWELQADGVEDLELDPTPAMFGPTASFLLTERLVLSASLFYGSFEGTRSFPGLDVDYEAERSDLDTVVAFIINPYVNVYGGLKYLRYDTENKDYGTKEEMNSFGLGLGVGGNFPIGETAFAIYGTLSASFLTGTYDVTYPYIATQSTDITYPIVSMEAGVRYNLEAIPLVFMGSFRYQESTIEIDTVDQYGNEISADIDESFWGPVLFIGYRFGG